MNVLELKNICKSLHNTTIYKNFNMSIKEGDCYVLAGKDNEGKTSILHAILGLNAIDSGSIILFEQHNCTKEAYKNIGYVPDELLCFSHMTGAQFLDMTISLRKLKNVTDYAAELISFFNINPALSLMDMSDDMNKCTYIISALLSKPKLLILDEPFNFLEDDSLNKLKTYIKNYTKSGNSVLITNENYLDTADICTKFSIIKDRVQSKTDELPDKYSKQKYITFTGSIDNFKDKNLFRRDPETNQISLFKLIDTKDNKFNFLFQGDTNILKNILRLLKYEDVTIKDITVDDQIFLRYDWMEENIDDYDWI